jgi:hypothetical protein
VEIGRGLEPGEWTQIGGERGDEVVGGALQTLDTYQFGEGIYTLRLTVKPARGSTPMVHAGDDRQFATQVVLSEPKADRLYVMEDDEQININALVNDTWSVGKVQYILDDVVIGTSTVSPFNERWRIEWRDLGPVEGPGAENWPGFESDDPDISPGRWRKFGNGSAIAVTSNGTILQSHVFKVKAVDRAGNETVSEEVRGLHPREEERVNVTIQD